MFLLETEPILKSSFFDKYSLEKKILCSQFTSSQVVFENAIDMTHHFDSSSSTFTTGQNVQNPFNHSDSSSQDLFPENMETDTDEISNENQLESIANDKKNKTECFEFKKNKLYYILINEPSKIGKLILDKYANSKILDKSRLKDLVVLHYMNKDPINYKVSKDQFVEISKQILELFPTETDANLYYVPYKIAKLFGAKNAKGSLYNTHNNIREEHFISSEEKCNANEPEGKVVDDFQSFKYNVILCHTDFQAQNSVKVGNEWNNQFADRVDKLGKTCKVKGGDIQFIKSYFDYLNHYTCLKSSNVTSLLTEDYEKIVQGLIKESKINSSSDSTELEFFKQKWSCISKKIIKYAVGCRTQDMNEFKKDKKKFLSKVTNEEALTVALCTISKCFTVPKKVTVNGKEITVDKKQINSSFILQVKKEEDLEQEIKKLECEIKNIFSEVYPIFVLLGPLKNIHTAYLKIHGNLLKFLDPLKGFDTYFKCLVVLRAWSPLCDHADLWKNVYEPLFKNELVLPLYVYYDDIEVGNPLGAHAGKNKFGVVYTSIACLPPEIASQLDSILF
ncbi:hypothetical protein TKK_0014091 [Trichogramma kaykai]